jgi:hypothetical protein
LILICREEGLGGVKRLLRSAVDPRQIRPKIWYLPIILLNPALLTMSYLAYSRV